MTIDRDADEPGVNDDRKGTEGAREDIEDDDDEPYDCDDRRENAAEAGADFEFNGDEPDVKC